MRELEARDRGAVEAVIGGDRERWLRWTQLSYEQLAELRQPPYGERAIALNDSGSLVFGPIFTSDESVGNLATEWIRARYDTWFRQATPETCPFGWFFCFRIECEFHSRTKLYSSSRRIGIYIA